MPFGKHRGKRLADVARDIEYVDWLLSQPWFASKYPRLFESFRSKPMLVRIHQIEEQKMRDAEDAANRLRAIREAEAAARHHRQQQKWLSQHAVKYEPRGIMPFGKYKGQDLAVVARDSVYYAWFKGSVYAQVNPELAADLKAIAQAITTGQTTMASVEFHDGGCMVYRPAMWCRGTQ
jgi:uncharacterized protein (DUF3820 family)